MKGVLSYAIVQLMATGYHPQEACEKAVYDLDRRLRAQRGQAGDLSVVAMNAKGQWGPQPILTTSPSWWPARPRL